MIYRRTLLRLMAGAVAAPGAALAQQAGKPVVVFAAASLQSVLVPVNQAFRQQTGVTVAVSAASSAALARQLEQGAPADLFISADHAWMEWAEQRALIRKETRRPLLRNRLVLIARKDDSLDLSIGQEFPLADAIGSSRLATGETSSVPAGRYAKQALTWLGVWDAVSPRVVGAENVRVALTLVARGEARLGIVYATDAASEPGVRVVGTFPQESHEPIIYPAALTAQSIHPSAGAYLSHLTSRESAAIFAGAGFLQAD